MVKYLGMKLDSLAELTNEMGKGYIVVGDERKRQASSSKCLSSDIKP